MFKNLMNFTYVRSTPEAIGFYIAYLIVTIVSAVVAVLLLGLVTNRPDDYDLGFRFGMITAVVISIGLSLLILRSRNLTGNFLYLILALGAGILAYFGGGVLGLIPVAYLSTRRK